MPKALSIFAMAVSGLLLLFFGLDLTMAFPFGGAHRGMSIFFIVCSAALGYLSWTTIREQT
jgi:hypothetical protein